MLPRAVHSPGPGLGYPVRPLPDRERVGPFCPPAPPFPPGAVIRLTTASPGWASHTRGRPAAHPAHRGRAQHLLLHQHARPRLGVGVGVRLGPLLPWVPPMPPCPSALSQLSRPGAITHGTASPEHPAHALGPGHGCSSDGGTGQPSLPCEPVMGGPGLGAGLGPLHPRPPRMPIRCPSALPRLPRASSCADSTSNG